MLVLAVGFNGLSIFGAPTYFQPIFQRRRPSSSAVGLSPGLARRYVPAHWPRKTLLPALLAADRT